MKQMFTFICVVWFLPVCEMTEAKPWLDAVCSGIYLRLKEPTDTVSMGAATVTDGFGTPLSFHRRVDDADQLSTLKRFWFLGFILAVEIQDFLS